MNSYNVVRELGAQQLQVTLIPIFLISENLSLLSSVVCPYSYIFTEQYQILFILKYLLSYLSLSFKKLLQLFLGTPKRRMKKQHENIIEGCFGFGFFIIPVNTDTLILMMYVPVKNHCKTTNFCNARISISWSQTTAKVV